MAGDLSQFTGAAPTKSIINAFSSGGASTANLAASTSTNFAKEAATPAMGTANTLTTVVSITGAGQIPYLVAYSKDVTPRTIRLRVTVDGVTSPYAFDATSNSISVVGTGLVAAGSGAGSAVGQGAQIRFNASCLIEVASSIIEGAGTTAVAYILE